MRNLSKAKKKTKLSALDVVAVKGTRFSLQDFAHEFQMDYESFFTIIRQNWAYRKKGKHIQISDVFVEKFNLALSKPAKKVFTYKELPDFYLVMKMKEHARLWKHLNRIIDLMLIIIKEAKDDNKRNK